MTTYSEEISFYYTNENFALMSDGPPNPAESSIKVVRSDKRTLRKLVWIFNIMHEQKNRFRDPEGLSDMHYHIQWQLGIQLSMIECPTCYLTTGRLLGKKRRSTTEIMDDALWLAKAAGLIYKLHDSDPWKFHFFLWNELIKYCPVCKMENSMI